jgi:hypothetical protein
MKSISTSRLTSYAVAASFAALLWAPAQAADVKPAATSASQAKAKKAAGTPAKAADCKATSNNPTGGTEDGGNSLYGKKPSGPKCPQDVAGKVATPAAK